MKIETTTSGAIIDGVEYVLKDSINNNAPSVDLEGKKYVIIRSKDSGCHAGYLEKESGDQVTLVKSRRLWYWGGAASLSQLAMEGVSKPDECKFPCPVNRITVYGICEKIEVTEQAQKIIEAVEIWKR